jgi:ribosomal protein S27E
MEDMKCINCDNGIGIFDEQNQRWTCNKCGVRWTPEGLQRIAQTIGINTIINVLRGEQE